MLPGRSSSWRGRFDAVEVTCSASLRDSAERSQHFAGALHARGNLDTTVEIDAVGVAAVEYGRQGLGTEPSRQDPWVGKAQAVELFHIELPASTAVTGASGIQQVVGAVGCPLVDLLLQFFQ